MCRAINKASRTDLNWINNKVARHRVVTVEFFAIVETGRPRIGYCALTPYRNSAPIIVGWKKLPIPDHVTSDTISNIVCCNRELIDTDDRLTLLGFGFRQVGDSRLFESMAIDFKAVIGHRAAPAVRLRLSMTRVLSKFRDVE